MKNILTIEKTNEIHTICQKYRIENYTINPNGSVNVNGSVDLRGYKFTKLPIGFNIVNGNFNCTGCGLTSLDRSPRVVTGSFTCNRNPIKSLKGSPYTIQYSFECNDTLLSSYEFGPKEVGGSYECKFNYIRDFIGFTTDVKSHIFFDVNFFPNDFTDTFLKLSYDERSIYFKYQAHFDIWVNGFDLSEFTVLIEEIRDGLL